MANKLVLRKLADGAFLLVVVLTVGMSAPAQTAAKPQASPAQTGAGARARVTETLVDSTVDDDPAVTKMLAVYAPKVRELDVVVGQLRGELKKGGTGAGSLGNFVADGMRWQARMKSGKTTSPADTRTRSWKNRCAKEPCRQRHRDLSGWAQRYLRGPS